MRPEATVYLRQPQEIPEHQVFIFAAKHPYPAASMFHAPADQFHSASSPWRVMLC